MPTTQDHTSESSFKKWYAKNGKKLNKIRRKRYESDADYRARQLKASKNWRKKNPGYRRAQGDTKPKALTIGAVAEELGTCPQTIRAIEKRGLIPENKTGSSHRKYTLKQVELMRPLIEYLQNTHYKAPGYEKQVKKLSAALAKHWKK